MEAKDKQSADQTRSLRRRDGAVDYRDEGTELDLLLGLPVPGSRCRSIRKNPNINAMRRKVEHACPASSLPATHAAQLSRTLIADGFRRPVLVRGSAGNDADASRRALGLRLPLHMLTPRGLVAAVGKDTLVPTFDVSTQDAGPKMTIQELAEYHATPPKQRSRLINVVSFSLADTRLADEIVPPRAVRDMDLVTAAWPPEEEPRPETLLYALLGPVGAYTDWHVDMGGSAVWYHVLQGCKVFLAAPSTPGNLAAFEQWATSPLQATEFLGDSLEGCVRIVLHAGDTLLLPSAWPHAVSTPEDSIVVGGNFMHRLDYGAIADTYTREQRLGVAPKFQFPLFKQLMWHAARVALGQLQHAHRKDLPIEAAGMSPWELGGLKHLARLLREWRALAGGHRRGGVPHQISDPDEFLNHLDEALVRYSVVGIDKSGDEAGISMMNRGRQESGDPEDDELLEGQEGGAVLEDQFLNTKSAFDDFGALDISFLDDMTGVFQEKSGAAADAENANTVGEARVQQRAGRAGNDLRRVRHIGQGGDLPAEGAFTGAAGYMIPVASREVDEINGRRRGEIVHLEETSEDEDEEEGMPRSGHRQPLHRRIQQTALDQLRRARELSKKSAAKNQKAPPRQTVIELLDSSESEAIEEESSESGDGDGDDDGWEDTKQQPRSRKTLARPPTKSKATNGVKGVPRKNAIDSKVREGAKTLGKQHRVPPPTAKPRLAAPRLPVAGPDAIPLGRRAAVNNGITEAKKPSTTAPLKPSFIAPLADERALAMQAISKVHRLRQLVQREESLLIKAQSGTVPLKDGGQKLEARLALQRQELEQKTNALQGRVLSFIDADGSRQGPFTPKQFGALVSEGIYPSDAQVHHSDGRVLSVEEAVAQPEPLTAVLLRELHEQHALTQDPPSEPAAIAPSERGTKDAAGTGRHDQGNSSKQRKDRHTGTGRRSREWRQPEHQRQRQAPPPAAPPPSAWHVAAHMEAALQAEEACDIVWTFQNPATGVLEGPYSKGELRALFHQDVLKTDVMVHDEEGGISTRLFSLLGYASLNPLNGMGNELHELPTAVELHHQPEHTNPASSMAPLYTNPPPPWAQPPTEEGFIPGMATHHGSNAGTNGADMGEQWSPIVHKQHSQGEGSSQDADYIALDLQPQVESIPSQEKKRPHEEFGGEDRRRRKHPKPFEREKRGWERNERSRDTGRERSDEGHRDRGRERGRERERERRDRRPSGRNEDRERSSTWNSTRDHSHQHRVGGNEKKRRRGREQDTSSHPRQCHHHQHQHHDAGHRRYPPYTELPQPRYDHHRRDTEDRDRHRPRYDTPAAPYPYSTPYSAPQQQQQEHQFSSVHHPQPPRPMFAAVHHQTHHHQGPRPMVPAAMPPAGYEPTGGGHLYESYGNNGGRPYDHERREGPPVSGQSLQYGYQQQQQRWGSGQTGQYGSAPWRH